MKEYQSLAHTRWDCKYHVVFIPKMRMKMIFASVRKHLGERLHELALQKECKIVEGQAQGQSTASVRRDHAAGSDRRVQDDAEKVDVRIPTTHGPELILSRHTQPEDEHRMFLQQL
jgi:hypothetical protein